MIIRKLIKLRKFFAHCLLVSVLIKLRKFLIDDRNMQVFDDLFGGLREIVYFCRQIVSKMVYC